MSDIRMRGTIASAGFASGDRLVLGAWRESPLGPFADVMWASKDELSTLLAPSQEHADFITSIYHFHRVEIVPIEYTATPTEVTVSAGPVRMSLAASGGMRVPFPRPAWFTQYVEGPIAAALMGVTTAGISPRGAKEWYQARAWRWVDAGSASIDGTELGRVVPEVHTVGFGFSNPPRRPSIVDVAVRIRPASERAAVRV